MLQPKYSLTLALATTLLATTASGERPDVPEDLAEGVEVFNPPGTPEAPGAPGIFALPFFGGSWLFGVTWTDNSNNEDGFLVDWHTGAGQSAQDGTVTASADSAGTYIALVPAGTRVRARVRAFNAAGESHWSDWVSGRVP